MDLHNYKKQFQRQVELLIEDKNILPENKDVALKFKDYLIGQSISFGKIGRYILDIRKFCKLLNKPFKEANKDDIRRVIAEMEQSELAPETKKCFKVMIRKLYRFIYDIHEKNVYPDVVKGISISIPRNKKKMPDELLTEEEIGKMIQHCNSMRNKAFISTLYESGCRVSEIGMMKIKHVATGQTVTRITVTGKTGSRKIPLISSVPYLQQWLNEHPKNNNPDAYLWYNQQSDYLGYNGIAQMIVRVARLAGITKKVNPHMFRHSRATNVASWMSEAVMKQYFGWGQDSKMCGIYISMNGEMMEKAVLKAHGMENKTEKREIKGEEKICQRCKSKNARTNHCCASCGLILDEGYAREKLKEDLERQRADEIMNKLLSDPEILEMIKKKLVS